MNIKTITTVDGVNEVDFGSAASRFYWIENLGSTTVYVSGNENIVPDGDNVKVLSAGCSTMVENLGGKVYILGAGKFQITNQGDKFPPFRNAPANVGGGVMASGNPVQIDGLQGGVPFSEMVVSGDNIIGQDLTVNVSGKNLLSYPYYEMTKTVNGITFTDNGDGTITVNGTATANTSFFLSKIVYKSNVNYVISGCPNGGGNSNFKIKGNSEGVNADDVGYGKTFSFNEDTECSASILIYKNTIVENIVFRPQLEIGITPTDYEQYHGSTTTITPTSNPYVIPNDIRQQDGLNVVSVSEGEISVTGVRKNAAIKKIWDEMGMDLLFDGTVTTGTNCITENVNGYNFLYFYGNLSSVSGESGNVTGSLVIPKTARAISAGQSLVLTTGVIYITVNIINIDSGVITFTVTPSDSGREIYEFKVFGIK